MVSVVSHMYLKAQDGHVDQRRSSGSVSIPFEGKYSATICVGGQLKTHSDFHCPAAQGSHPGLYIFISPDPTHCLVTVCLSQCDCVVSLCGEKSSGL